MTKRVRKPLYCTVMSVAVHVFTEEATLLTYRCGDLAKCVMNKNLNGVLLLNTGSMYLKFILLCKVKETVAISQ